MAREVPNLGEIVYWYPHGQKNQPPQPAMVTGLGMNSLNLNIFSPKTYNMLIRDGVRHVDDQETKESQFKESGGWDWSPLRAEIIELKKQVAYLFSASSGILPTANSVKPAAKVEPPKEQAPTMPKAVLAGGK